MSSHVNAVNDFIDDNLNIAAILERITLGPQEEDGQLLVSEELYLL